MKKHLIIGIDPGNTIAIAGLDLEGNLVFCTSFEHGGIKKAVSEIEKSGTPSIIATDVNPAPEFALRLSSYFNARLSVPKKDMREDEKRLILKKLRSKIPNIGENNHERDAISAAITAYKDHQNSLRSILSSDHPKDLREGIAHYSLQGYRKEDALFMLTRPKTIDIGSKKSKTDQREKPTDPNLQKRLKTSLVQIEQMQKRIDTLEHQNSELIQRLKGFETGVTQRVKKDRTLINMKAKIIRLEQRLKDSQKKNFHLSRELKKRKKARVEKKKDINKSVEKGEKESTKSLKKLDDLNSLEQMVSEYRKNRSS